MFEDVISINFNRAEKISKEHRYGELQICVLHGHSIIYISCAVTTGK